MKGTDCAAPIPARYTFLEKMKWFKKYIICKKSAKKPRISSSRRGENYKYIVNMGFQKGILFWKNFNREAGSMTMIEPIRDGRRQFARNPAVSGNHSRRQNSSP
jgi:hypothetical protein